MATRARRCRDRLPYRSVHYDLDSQEVELGGASRTEAGGHRPDGTAVERESKAVAGQLVDAGHVSLAVEELVQTGDLLVERLACQLALALLDPPSTTSLEDARDQLGVFVLEVAEELDREVNSQPPGKQGFAQLGAVVEIDRPSRPSAFLTRGHEPAGLERSEMLADSARGSPHGLRHRVGGRFATTLHGDEDVPLGRRQFD